MTPCGIPADVCHDCADDCPAAGHDGRVCAGGAHVCTCRKPFDEEGFKAWLTAEGFAPATVAITLSHVRRMNRDGVGDGLALEETYEGLSGKARRGLYYALRKYCEFEAAAGFDYAAFRAYLETRRTLTRDYSRSIAHRLRECHKAGIARPADVDTAFSHLSRSTRRVCRAALEFESEFRAAQDTDRTTQDGTEATCPA